MPPKRKNAEEQLLSSRLAAPRRSTRRTKGASSAEDGSQSPAPGIFTKEIKNDDGILNNDIVVRDSVDRVMQQLGEMEHKFHNDAKKQRLAIESSALGYEDLAKRESCIKQPLESATTVDKLFSNDQTTTVEKATLDDDEAELAPEDSADVSFDDETAADRGARRPLPVNSEVLPLPWKGRLGYVSAILRRIALPGHTLGSFADYRP